MTDPVTPLNPQQTATQEAKASKDGYVHDVLVELDDLGNVITGGHPGETISSRDGRDALKDEAEGKKHAPAEILADVLDVFEKDHDAKAIAGDDERAKELQQLETQSGGINPPQEK